MGGGASKQTKDELSQKYTADAPKAASPTPAPKPAGKTPETPSGRKKSIVPVGHEPTAEELKVWESLRGLPPPDAVAGPPPAPKMCVKLSGVAGHPELDGTGAELIHENPITQTWTVQPESVREPS